jgi:hypothetical protein
LKDKDESVLIHITVDSTKIVRCEWCGSAEGEEWRGGWQGLCCSSDCALAENPHRLLVLFLAYAIIMSLSMLMIGPIRLDTFVIGSTFLILTGTPLLYLSILGRRKRIEVPKDSRRDERLSDTALLEALPPSVACQKCDGNIDLTRVGEDRVYICDHCGANGIIEILETTQS